MGCAHISHPSTPVVNPCSRYQDSSKLKAKASALQQEGTEMLDFGCAIPSTTHICKSKEGERERERETEREIERECEKQKNKC
jgi:uncharacterized protein YutD